MTTQQHDISTAVRMRNADYSNLHKKFVATGLPVATVSYELGIKGGNVYVFVHIYVTETGRIWFGTAGVDFTKRGKPSAADNAAVVALKEKIQAEIFSGLHAAGWIYQPETENFVNPSIEQDKAAAAVSAATPARICKICAHFFGGDWSRRPAAEDDNMCYDCYKVLHPEQPATKETPAVVPTVKECPCKGECCDYCHKCGKKQLIDAMEVVTYPETASYGLICGTCNPNKQGLLRLYDEGLDGSNEDLDLLAVAQAADEVPEPDTGAIAPVATTFKLTCWHCYGSGLLADYKDYRVACDACAGTGKLEQPTAPDDALDRMIYRKKLAAERFDGSDFE